MKTKPGKPTESWIEYLEDELDPSLKDDFTMLLANSKEDEKTFNDLKRLRSSVKRADPYKKSEFNQKLFDSIMSDVQKTQIHPRWRLAVTNPKTWGSVAASILLVIGFLGLYKTTSKDTETQMVEVSSDKTEWIVQESAKNPDVLAQTVNSHLSEEDMAFDKLALQAEDLNDDELAQVMDDILK